MNFGNGELTGSILVEAALMVSWRLWRDTLCLRIPEANKIPTPTGLEIRVCSDLKKGRLSLTATLTLQSSGWQFAVLTVVAPTLTTLVITSTPDGSGVSVVEGVANGFR